MDVADYLHSGSVRAAFRAAPRSGELVREIRFPHMPPLAGFPTFVALDFETADPQRDSACSLAIVRVEHGVLTVARSFLIRPPRVEEPLPNAWVHGITTRMVRRAPEFADVWDRCAPMLAGAAFIAAHNAAFDRSVLFASCRAHGIDEPGLPWECTVKRARSALHIKAAKLPAVCELLGIHLEHHDPLSDAVACAQVMIATSLLDVGM